jgi:hypothetical protein
MLLTLLITKIDFNQCNSFALNSRHLLRLSKATYLSGQINLFYFYIIIYCDISGACFSAAAFFNQQLVRYFGGILT